MSNIDKYLQPREAISPNVSMQHYDEVGGYCPLCGEKLLIQVKGRVKKQYEIAHIYPNSPNEHQRQELKGLERLGDSCEDFENKIALCVKCHGIYNDYTTKEDYLKILNIKKKLMKENRARESVAQEELEKDLLLIIERLAVVADEELDEIALKYKGITIANKLEKEYNLLRRKISSNVCTYYFFIRENMKNMSVGKGANFDLIASEVRTAYLRAAQSVTDKAAIFNTLVSWMKSKIPEASEESCEIMISYFVQDCEVFDEITE